jgi:hypothetical protein
MDATYESIKVPSALLTAHCVGQGGQDFRMTIRGNVVQNNGQLDREVPGFLSNIADVENKARAKFYKALRRSAVSFSGPTFLGELRETLHMLRRPAQALWSDANGYLDSLAKAKRRSPKHWTKTLSGLWLEHSFGWLPLLSDAKSAAEAYRRLYQKPRSKVIAASFKGNWDLSNSLDPVYDRGPRPLCGTGLLTRTEATRTDEANVRYKAKINARVEMTPWDNMALFGFTPSEFIPTAWELLPWSFLVDYFTNIGDVITASVTSTTDIAYVVRTERTFARYFGWTAVLHSDMASYYTPPYWTVTVGDGRCNWELNRKTIRRTKGSGVPLPVFSSSFDLSDGQLGNIAALLGQSRLLHPQNPRFRYRGIPF